MDLFDDIIRDVMIQVTNLQSRTRNNGAISIEGRNVRNETLIFPMGSLITFL